MKNIFLLTLFIGAIGPVLRAQRVENLRFVFIGEEDKPHGTLSISIGACKIPTDRGVVDDHFGKCILTDTKTFDSVRQFIRESKYATGEGTVSLSDSLNHWLLSGCSYYKIIDSDSSVVYLNGKYWIDFFDELKATLRAHSLDPRVISAF